MLLLKRGLGCPRSCFEILREAVDNAIFLRKGSAESCLVVTVDIVHDSKIHSSFQSEK